MNLKTDNGDIDGPIYTYSVHHLSIYWMELKTFGADAHIMPPSKLIIITSVNF